MILSGKTSHAERNKYDKAKQLKTVLMAAVKRVIGVWNVMRFDTQKSLTVFFTLILS